MKWETAFRVAAHELRSPAGVISGYTRLLKSGRLDADGRANALTQIDRASERLEALGQAASDLSLWLEPRSGPPKQAFDICTLLEKAVLKTTASERVSVTHDPNVCDWVVRTDEPAAFTSALAAIINATLREVQVPKGPVQVGVYNADRPGWCDIVMASRAFTHDDIPALHESVGALSLLDSGGLGLDVVLGTSVLEAHGAEWWTSNEFPGLNGIRMPVELHEHN